METYIENIARKIVEVAEKENQQLMAIAKSGANPKIGIFHMPELAFAYECGKQIMQDVNKIFGDNIPEWSREKKLENGGLTDLIFAFDDGQKIAIEFKMRGTGTAYLDDLDKLSKLKDAKTTKIFCAIIDTFKKDLRHDGRVIEINDDSRTEKNLYLVSFATNQTWYESDVSALVGIWKIK